MEQNSAATRSCTDSVEIILILQVRNYIQARAHYVISRHLGQKLATEISAGLILGFEVKKYPSKLG